MIRPVDRETTTGVVEMGPRVIVRICRQMANGSWERERLYDDFGHHMSLKKRNRGESDR